MAAFNGDVAVWFHDHHGIASTDELTALGVDALQRRYLLELGVFESLFEGVYRLRSSPLTFEARCRAVCAADWSLAVSCVSSGALMGLRRCPTKWMHVTTTRRTKPVGPSVKVHRTYLDLSTHIVERDDGIRHTDAVHTFFDLARHLPDSDLRSVGEQIIADELATHAELLAYVQQVATRGRPGGRRALRVISERTGEGKAADSHGEVVLLDALHRAGLTEFVRHPPVRLPSGATIHPDLGVPRVGFYVEVDHPTWHSQQASVDYDKTRDLHVRLVGGEVERIPTGRIRTELPAVVAELAVRYHQRCVSVGAGLR